MALQVSRNPRTIRLNFQVRAEPSKTNRHLRVSFFKGPPVLTLRPLPLIDHCMPALRKTRRQPVSVFAARAMGSWCDQRKHARQTLCRAATLRQQSHNFGIADLRARLQLPENME
jgi:hypothetical protein